MCFIPELVGLEMLPKRLQSWLRRRRLQKTARRIVSEAFHSPDMLRGTSLKRRHAARWVLLDYELEADTMARIWFGILRHPRPYPFSKQSHKVLECYLYDVAAKKIQRVQGHNVTRARGRDADD